MKTTRLAVLAALILALGCGKEPSDSGETISKLVQTQEFRDACAALPTCAQPRYQSTGPVETIWRIQVVREAPGSVRFGRIDSVEVTEGRGVPMGPANGDYLLAGVDENGTPVDGQVIQFPKTLRIEYENKETPAELVELTGKSAVTTGYVRALPTVVSLALIDESGKTIAKAEVPATQASLGNRQLPIQLGLAAPALAQSVVNTSSCSHVEILTAADSDLIEYLPDGIDQLTTPQTRQLAVILAGLGRMTPLLCQSVSTIAFGTFDPNVAGMVQTWILGDTIMVNSSIYTETVLTPGNTNEPFRRMDLQQTILHESGHAAEALLNSLGLDLDTFIANGDWNLNARAMAEETIERVRLKSGFGDEWSRVHDSFVELGWATDYVSYKDSRTFPPAKIANSGFMSPYGASGHADDIAETIGWTYVGSDYARAGVGNQRRDFACTQMMLHSDKDLPANLAAIYTKLHFLQDLGLVDPDDVVDCTGVNIGIPITTKGFESWQGGVMNRTYTSGVTAGIGTKPLTQAKVFTFKAEGPVEVGGKSYPGKIELHLDLESSFSPIEFVPWPRGAYQFGSFWDGNNLMMRIEGAGAANWDASQGFAIVTEASNKRIVGSIFLTQALRVSAPSPLPAYDSYNPPKILRFMIAK